MNPLTSIFFVIALGVSTMFSNLQATEKECKPSLRALVEETLLTKAQVREIPTADLYWTLYGITRESDSSLLLLQWARGFTVLAKISAAFSAVPTSFIKVVADPFRIEKMLLHEIHRRGLGLEEFHESDSESESRLINLLSWVMKSHPSKGIQFRARDTYNVLIYRGFLGLYGPPVSGMTEESILLFQRVENWVKDWNDGSFVKAWEPAIREDLSIQVYLEWMLGDLTLAVERMSFSDPSLASVRNLIAWLKEISEEVYGRELYPQYNPETTHVQREPAYTFSMPPI